MTAIAISRIHFPVTTLGPGNRIGIWFQGCSIRCPGCISSDTWAAGRGLTTVDCVVEAVEHWLPKADGLTISGGEPFDQTPALGDLLRQLKSKTDKDVLVFSGHSLESLEKPLNGMSGLIDALITDPFLVERTQELALRGSDNQRLTLLTPAGRQRFSSYERMATSGDQKVDLMIDESGVAWMAGIPGRGDFTRLAAILSTQHHKVITTEDRSLGASRYQAND